MEIIYLYFYNYSNLVDEEKKVRHIKMSNSIENIVSEGKKYILPGMDKDSVSIC